MTQSLCCYTSSSMLSAGDSIIVQSLWFTSYYSEVSLYLILRAIQTVICKKCIKSECTNSVFSGERKNDIYIFLSFKISTC